MENTIAFDPMRLARLKRAIAKAEAEKAETFTFDGHEFLVTYAKYMAEYLDTKFPKY